MKRLLIAFIPAVLVAATVATGAAVQAKSPKVFAAALAPLNAGAQFPTTTGGTYTIPTAGGTAVVSVSGDDITITVNVTGVNPLTLHPQHIHAGTTCPTAAQDMNNDGVVDVIEGLPMYGPILVNLDSDLSSNPAGTFPTADASGSYSYNESASRAHLQAELQQALRLGDRHVVIHGIDPNVVLPSSVATLPGLPAWATLPVACGMLHETQ